MRATLWLSCLLFACSGGGTTEEETEEEVTLRTTPTTTDPSEELAANIMAPLDRLCEEEDCIAGASALDLTSLDSPLQYFRSYFWLVHGFPESSDYEDFHGGSSEVASLVPKEGILGKLDEIRGLVVEGIMNDNASLSECADIDSDTPIEISASETLTIGLPLYAPVSHWPRSEIYDKRVTYVNTSTGTTVIFEFYCDYDGMMVHYSRAPTGDQKQTFYLYYDNETTIRYLELAMVDDRNLLSTHEAKMLLHSQIDPLNQTFKTWLTRSDYNPTTLTHLGYRFTIVSDYATGEASFQCGNLGKGYAFDEFSTLGSYQGISVTGQAPNTGESTNSKTGCAESFKTVVTALNDSSECAGLVLEEAKAPAINGVGDFSIKWVTTELSVIHEVQ